MSPGVRRQRNRSMILQEEFRSEKPRLVLPMKAGGKEKALAVLILPSFGKAKT